MIGSATWIYRFSLCRLSQTEKLNWAWVHINIFFVNWCKHGLTVTYNKIIIFLCCGCRFQLLLLLLGNEVGDGTIQTQAPHPGLEFIKGHLDNILLERFRLICLIPRREGDDGCPCLPFITFLWRICIQIQSECESRHKHKANTTLLIPTIITIISRQVTTAHDLAVWVISRIALTAQKVPLSAEIN